MKQIIILLIISACLSIKTVAQKTHIWLTDQTLNLKISTKIEQDKKMGTAKMTMETKCGKYTHSFSIWDVYFDPYYDSLLNKLKVDSLPIEDTAKEKIAHDAGSYLGYCLESEEFISSMFTLLFFSMNDDLRMAHYAIRDMNSRPLEKLRAALTNFKIQQKVKE